MRHNTKQGKQSGFTIIEVLIVLAIAGLIMLVVFLAVPALQRNSRNTQAKSEASSLLGAVSEYTSNNNGKLPTASSSTTTTSEAAKVIGLAKLQNITTLVVEAQGGSTAASPTTAVLRLAAKCGSPVGSNATTPPTTPPGAGRQVALLYMIENSAGNVVACQES